jgi:hypothetical protein
VRLIGHGSPAIRATHAKTLELTADAEITERATCVVAVGVERAAAPLAGPVRITISAGAEEFTLEARANPAWHPAGPAVIRRSPLRLPGTLATHASAAASDLPRPLVAALQHREARVEVTVEPIHGRPCAVLFAVDPGLPRDARLLAEFAAADLVVAEDDEAARMFGERVGHGPVSVDGRVLVLAVRDLPGQTVLAALRDVEVETIGLPPTLAAAAASPSRGPLLLAPDGADPRELLRRTPAGTRLVLSCDAEQLPDLMRRAAEIRGPGGAVLVQPYAPPVRIAPGGRPTLPSKASVVVCFDADDGDDGEAALDPRVRAALDGLLADGVPTKTAANALAALTGWDRRRAYDTVVGWRSDGRTPRLR